MTYTFNPDTGLITRDTDGKVVAPMMAGDVPSGPFPASTDQDCVEFQAWCAEGNKPSGYPSVEVPNDPA